MPTDTFKTADEFTVSLSDCKTMVRIQMLKDGGGLQNFIDREEVFRLLTRVIVIYEAMPPPALPPDSANDN